ncbi:hypothetical protein A2697_00100 [Candidatus Curtissbacteria bacterium RIFCSPHIGHO2_01_FULL_41_44]|uniref:Penicillin-binding protein 2 n=1 Tax=Candidatus Curtissbacteria bacterium RIFCSPLOWO2_01_FULL_42_50 TaxID=1797730 RepID=A0A1F5H759_9BACT|nr:MAG: hypothetical protein A3C33_01945 [Candidatus Curtissbacteria bacterium RIFCSPHIGHO2_02_FULL_42_58]OGD94400.1 MAG: hypothetical protein A2697_00100 [Candidatus Curtissbacteria bacterium RIFCSPHIGHO2_01_FULL_41_44]OGD97674.1 MAG: hypothetical protein A3E71_01025 [Candidatus Curtissbacteria bacterium RIFCSPHIGHO2_12_FULL_42_33]OGD99905.1 MAG: hypothetical protein A3B54_00100 [Candidatus Curtissbacteria bacterium RIFCSPLOWO2_01_FULL_42_50]OGE02764.1 MAG: hypothetical protein A3G16_03065 [Ca
MRQKKVLLPQSADFIFHEKVRRFWFFQKDRSLGHLSFDSLNPSSLFILRVAVFCALFISLARLFMLTVVNGEKYRSLAEENRVRLVTIEAARGKIFDRNGKLMADSLTNYFLKKGENVLSISYEQAQDLEKSGLAHEDFEGGLGKIFRSVTREYLLGSAAAHILGYTTGVGEEGAGRLGIEASYDNFLKGQAGKKLIEVDANERKVSILGSIDPEAGRDLTLTIDATLQKIVYEVLKKHAERVGSGGTVILQNPSSGEVLALVSYPSFDPTDISRFLESSNQPFFNRAVSGIYPPGSIFKIISALSALESGKITGETEIEDVGEFELGGVRFSNWYYNQYGGRDGILKVDRAIARSNDIYFYRISEKVGLDGLRKMAIKFGFGQKSGIDLPEESLGLVPDEVWKKSTLGAPWYLGDTLHFSIGQGFMLVTPIQINSMTSYMASGKLTRPYLVSKIGSPPAGRGEFEIGSKIIGEKLVSEENYKLVREGMRKACQTGGTGWPFFDAAYSVGCKTGTAEKSLGNPHAWFTAFVPFDDPKISITVIIEEGGEGSGVAGPVAKEILDWWFGNR